MKFFYFYWKFSFIFLYSTYLLSKLLISPIAYLKQVQDNFFNVGYLIIYYASHLELLYAILIHHKRMRDDLTLMSATVFIIRIDSTHIPGSLLFTILAIELLPIEPSSPKEVDYCSGVSKYLPPQRKRSHPANSLYWLKEYWIIEQLIFVKL